MKPYFLGKSRGLYTYVSYKTFKCGLNQIEDVSTFGDVSIFGDVSKSGDVLDLFTAMRVIHRFVFKNTNRSKLMSYAENYVSWCLIWSTILFIIVLSSYFFALS